MIRKNGYPYNCQMETSVIIQILSPFKRKQLRLFFFIGQGIPNLKIRIIILCYHETIKIILPMAYACK